MSLAGKRILLIVAGGIAAYKSLELIRRLRDRGAIIRPVLTQGGAHFVTALSLASLAEQPVYEDLFSPTEDFGMTHIRLTRESDLVIVAPATADLMAKMTHGLADDLASTLLLASDKPILIAPTMNLMMWQHAATQANVATLLARGILTVGPGAGDLACGEVGDGRMAEVPDIIAAAERALGIAGPLAGKHALVTSGPTHEPIDPVRYIANRSSGKQGHAIAAALAALGSRVTLVSGPVALPDPKGVRMVKVESASEMLEACLGALPAEIAICAAAVADWRPAQAASGKLKKSANAAPPALDLVPNPDILATLSKAGPNRPRLVVGFAAETESLIDNAKSKLKTKGCDLIVANDVSPATGTFGGDHNTVSLVSGAEVTTWPPLPKSAVAERLAAHVANLIGQG